ncbi:MAG: SRPBCC family protein [Mucilaginibacter sp.]
MENLTLKTEIKFNAPAAKVWHGLTDPGMIKKYFFGTDLKTDWQPGSPIVWSGEWQGKTYEDHGKILEVTPGKHAKYTYWSQMSGTEDKPENYQMLTYDLDEKDGVTTLTLTQENIASEQAKEHSEQNWHSVFDGLRKLIE